MMYRARWEHVSANLHSLMALDLSRSTFCLLNGKKHPAQAFDDSAL
jgi:hypothetical protein